MISQSERGEWREPQNDPARSVRYELKLELRRLERCGRGDSPYASAIRDVLWVLANSPDEHLVGLLEREMSQPAMSEADEPYAHALRMVLVQLDEPEKSTHELFTYYLRCLERQGRGDEPFAQAIREALASNDATALSSLLHGQDDGAH